GTATCPSAVLCAQSVTTAGPARSGGARPGARPPGRTSGTHVTGTCPTSTTGRCRPTPCLLQPEEPVMTTTLPLPPRPDTLVPPLAPPAAHPRAGRLRAFGRAPRVVALDIARGIAVLGMAAAHTAALPGELRWDAPSPWVELVNGRSSILFALLAGISLAIMPGRTRVPTGAELAHARLRLVARGLVIFVVGLVLELLGTSIAVILTFYGAVYAVAILFVGMRVSSVLVWAASLAVAGPALVGGLMALAPSSFGSGITFVLEGTYSIVVWTALMLAGLALGRLDVTRRRTAALALAAGVVLSTVGYTVGGFWGEDQYGEDSSWFSS